MKNYISKYISGNKEEIIYLLGCIVIGFIAAVITFLAISGEIKSDIKHEIENSLKLSQSDEYIRVNVIYSGIKNNIVFIILIWLSSIMMYGKFLIGFFYLAKGFSIGIYTYMLFIIFGFGYGLLEVLLLVIFVNAIYIPAIIGVGVIYINNNNNIFYKGKSFVNDNYSKYFNLIRLLLYTIVIFSSVILEQLMSSFTISIYNKLP